MLAGSHTCTAEILLGVTIRVKPFNLSTNQLLPPFLFVLSYNSAINCFTFSPIKSLTLLNASGSMCLGSGICQSTNFLAGIHGQASPQPIVTTTSNGAYCSTSCNDLLSCLLKS